MSITDELRTEARGFLTYVYTAEQAERLLAIADRIDEEHEQQCAESWMRGHDAWAAIDRSDEMAEHGWVRLPKDADGEYIRIGDVMEWCDSGETLTVEGIGIDVLFYIDGENAEWTAARNKRHYHAPTVEDVLREFANEVYADADNEIRDRDFLCAKYAKRLKLAEGEGE